MAVRTDLNRFSSVQFRAVLQSWEWLNWTEGPVFFQFSPVQLPVFSSSMNWTFKHYLNGCETPICIVINWSLRTPCNPSDILHRSCITIVPHPIESNSQLVNGKGLHTPEGTGQGYVRVRVRVWTFLPSTYPYPWGGYKGIQGQTLEDVSHPWYQYSNPYA